MKRITPTLACVLTIVAFAVGCGPNPKATLDGNTATELSADDLALLQDFHAWKLAVPQSQQPIKSVNLVLMKADGTRVPLFGTAYTDPTPAWTNILLGFRYEGGRFAGRFLGRGPKTGETYIFSFTNASTEHPRSWAEGALWSGPHAELATFWTSEEAASRVADEHSTLAIELVK